MYVKCEKNGGPILKTTRGIVSGLVSIRDRVGVRVNDGVRVSTFYFL